MKINKEMSIAEVVEIFPDTVDIFFEYGLNCVGCGAAAYESIEEGARGHGMSDDIIQSLVEELNEVVKDQDPNEISKIKESDGKVDNNDFKLEIPTDEEIEVMMNDIQKNIKDD